MNDKNLVFPELAIMPERAAEGLTMKHPYPKDFEAAYASYPRHVGKGDALKAWNKAIKLAEPGIILAAVVAFASSPAGRSGRFTPHFGSWLGAQRWLDDPIEWQRGADAKTVAKDKAMDDAAVYARFKALPVDKQVEIRKQSERADPHTTDRRASIVHFARKAGV